MDEFKDAPLEGAGNKKKKIVGVVAGILAFFAACKIFKKCKKRKQKKAEEAEDES